MVGRTRQTDATPSAPPAAALAVVLMVCAAASGQGWVDRYVEPVFGNPSPYLNADVIALPDGRVAVGVGSQFMPGVLASMTPGDRFFERTIVGDPAATISVDADAYGHLFIGAAPFGQATVHEDLGGWTAAGGYEPTRIGSAWSPAITLTVDRHNVPGVVYMEGRRYVFSRFDATVGQWADPQPLSAQVCNSASPSLAFDADNRPVVGYVQTVHGPQDGELVVEYQAGPNDWRSIAPPEPAMVYGGVSVATGEDGSVAFAYRARQNGNPGRVRVGIDDGHRTIIEELDPAVPNTSLALLSPRSLTYDAHGNLAMVLGGVGAEAQLARRDAAGNWTYDPLPTQSAFRGCNLTFDAANHPYITIYDHPNQPTPYVHLLGKNLTPLLRGDLNLSDSVEAADVDPFARAIVHQADYLADHPGMAEPDLAMLGDYNNDFGVDDEDGHALCDSLITDPIIGLAHRTAGYVAFDTADLDPNLGDGDGNFFNTALATPKLYQAGDSRGDLSGWNTEDDLFTGVADQTIDAMDIDYLFTQITSATPDPRADLNDDGSVDQADADLLIEQILGSPYGNANLDGIVNLDDFFTLRSHFGQAVGWAGGDFTGDQFVNLDDFFLLRGHFGQSVSPQTQQMFDQFLAIHVPEPMSVLAWALMSLIPRRSLRARAGDLTPSQPPAERSASR